MSRMKTLSTVDSTASDGEGDRVIDIARSEPGDDSANVKKTKLKPHLKKQWCIPAQYNGEFVAQMEDVLEVYALPYDEEIPMFCVDERPFQFLDEKLKPIPMRPDSPRKEDYEYVRNGVCSIFTFTEPLAGWRHVHASARCTKRDWAFQIQELLEVHYPKAKRVRLVMENLNTHAISSLYENFQPEIALRLARRLEIHFTPKHGSWLNIAESELNALTKQCLSRRLPDLLSLQAQLSPWEIHRNSSSKSVDWQFSTVDARDKLKRLYPKF